MGNILPSVWDDDRTKMLSMSAGLGWLYLLTGPESQFLPGILRAGPGILADGVWCISSAAESEAAIGEMAAVGLIEVDSQSRVIRVPNAPKHNPPGNQQVVIGWYRKWLTVPDCRLRAHHVESLHVPVLALIRKAERKGDMKKADAWRGVWRDTFGSHSEESSDDDPSPQASLFETPKGQATPHNRFHSPGEDGNRGDESSNMLSNASSNDASNPGSTHNLTPAMSEHTHLVQRGVRHPVEDKRQRQRSAYTSPEREKEFLPRAPARDPGQKNHTQPPRAPTERDRLLERYAELFAEHTGHRPQQPLAQRQLAWADERLGAVGLPECLSRLERLYHDTPHYLTGTLTFQTFERNFDRLAAGRRRSGTAPPPRDPRVGYYEPNPATKWAGGKVKL